MRGAAQNHGIDAAKIELQEEIFELRMQGLAIREISRRLEAQGKPCSKSSVARMLDDEWIRRVAPKSDKLREIDLEKLDRREDRIAQELLFIEVGADPLSVARLTATYLQVLQTRAKICGYLISKVSLVDDKGTDVQIPEALAQALRHVEERNADREAEIRASGDG